MLNPATPEFLTQLQADLPDGVLGEVAPKYLEEPRGTWAGQAAAVLRPRSSAEVAQIITACNAARVGVVPYGGGTGLVGGQVLPEPAPAPVILSLEKMTAVRGLWSDENALAVEAGAILADVQAAAQDAGRLFALSLASEGSAQIGGLLATNAGGVNVLRYGNARDQVLGIEAVLPDGSILNGMKRLRKDNTGYDLRHLLLGSEGTLGIITAAVLKLHPIPARRATAFLTVTDPAAAVKLLTLAQDICGETISAFELISGMGLQFLRAHMPDQRQPLADSPEWAVLIELGTAAQQDPETMLEDVFTRALEGDLCQDGVIAQNDTQRMEIWAVRETIPEANRAVGAVASHDVSLPISDLPAFIDEGNRRITALAPLRINAFGHLGDGNLHYNIFPPEGRAASDYYPMRAQVYQTIHDLVHEMGGSVSAEHGIGRKKVDDLIRYGDATKLSAMRAIKCTIDPNGIMNPGAIFA